MEGSLKPLVSDDQNIKAVFVGGKGGVGKTSCACSIAIQFALNHPEKNVLLISTDPAHNVSDAFVQQFSGKPSKVEGIKNLFACEVDPAAAMKEELSRFESTPSSTDEEGVGEFQSFVTNLPGIDEAMAISSVLNYFDGNSSSGEESFGIVVFDTAPTGHTLRLLQLPALLKVGLQKLTSWKSKFSTMFSSLTSMVFADESQKRQVEKTKLLESRMKVWLDAVTRLSEMFKDKKSTQFVCVCNASFLSVYETKRLVNELKVAEIHVEYIIVNMLMPLYLATVGNNDTTSNLRNILQSQNVNSATVEAITDAVLLCGGVSRMQSHYLDLLREEQELKLVLLPLLAGEVRGVDDLLSFSEKMLSPDPKVLKAGSEKVSWSGLSKNLNNYVANTSPKLMNKALYQNGDKEAVDEESTDNSVQVNITPEMISVVQGMIMKPGGVDELLNNQIVLSERAKPENADLDEFLSDIANNGLMAGFKYLNNPSVMSKLAEIAKRLA